MARAGARAAIPLRCLPRPSGSGRLAASFGGRAMAAGSWALAEELFARGDAGFVDELRRVHFADRLGDFAPRWYESPQPFARQALFDYLAWPLNAYRHEPLVKRLFKRAEAAGDDELMGAFLVAFDRTVRRARRA